MDGIVHILGISAFYHDSAAAIIKGDRIVAAAQEERFTRKKHDQNFPVKSIEYCLKAAKIRPRDLKAVVFYDKPFIKFERLIETYLAFAPHGFSSFIKAMPVWLKDKLFLKDTIKLELSNIFNVSKSGLPPILFAGHHQSHAASSFFPSPYEQAAILCLDGVGEWATTTLWDGDKNKMQLKWEIDFPHSLGLLYSAFTYFCGFKVNSGEYKLMGLAPYGHPTYVNTILDNLIDLKEDGSFRLNMKYFNYATGLTMTNKHFENLFGIPARKSEMELTQQHMDLARSIQAVTEEVVMRLAVSAHKETGRESLCLAGGVALNCVSNGKLLREGPFKNIWIQPAAGDAGGALGAALSAYYEYYGEPRIIQKTHDSMQGGYLGPNFSNIEVKEHLETVGATYVELDDDKLNTVVADLLAQGKVIGYCQGRMEFGPRALGARSILGDPRNREMQTTMNLKIKYRESFRPFAPAVLSEDVSNYFEHSGESPYMLIVAPVKNNIRYKISDSEEKLFGIEKLKVPRSEIPAVTHVDYSARVQTVHAETNPRFYNLLSKFKEKTGCSVLVNTSFNVRGEPIVCSPQDAYRCFMRTEMDYLVFENILIDKITQPKLQTNDSWKKEFELD